MATRTDAVLVGGPRDGDVVEVGDAGLVEVEAGGVIHRYVPTTRTRPVGGDELPVYNHDGVVSPGGAEDGVESAGDRMASPLADEKDGG